MYHRMWRSLLVFGLLISAALSASAADYPNKPIMVIVPFPAGGPPDILIRNLADRMQMSLGQSLIIENVVGGGGTVGTGRLYRAAPDGYTICVGHVGTFVTNGVLFDLPYDLVADFAPISLLPSNPYLIVGRKDFPADTLREFMAYLKANPGKVSMGHPGIGSNPHLLGLQLAKAAGSTMTYVPYRGSGPAMIDLIGGHIDLMVDQVQTSSSRVKDGSIKAFAIAAPARSNAVPDVPTVDEAGTPGLYAGLWHGLWAPRDTPAPIIQKLQAAVQDALADPKVRSQLIGVGMEIPPREQQTPEALVTKQKAEIAYWWPLIKSENLKIQ